MKTRLLAWIGLVALVLGQGAELSAQRGSKGSQGSPSRGSQSSGGSARPAASQGSRGSSAAPSRPSSSPQGSSRPSAASQGSSRPSSPTGGSIRPSSPPSPRPSASSPTVRPSTPSSTPSGGSVSRPSTSPPSPSASNAGRELYGSRAQPTVPTTSAPTSGTSSAPSSRPDSTSGEPRALAPSASPGVSIPPERTQPRTRFPAPYSPAGSATRPPGRVPRADAPSALPGRSLVSPGTKSLAPREPAPRPKGPMVRYGEGPTRRVEAPKTLVPKKDTRTPELGKGASSGKNGAGKGGAAPAAKPTKTKTLGELKRSAPDKLDDVRVLTRGISRAHDVATGVAVGVFGGGVQAGGYYGGLPLDDDWCDDPFGWNNPWYGSSWCWWGGSWWGYGCSWGWYTPWWWWCTRPYYATYYSYWPVATVIYTEPEVIYIERESVDPAEPVGEAVVGAPVQPTASLPQNEVPSAESPLSIAAQRYLELGDRAFREGRYADAVQFYAKAVEFAPDQGALYLVLSDALFAAGDYHYGAYAVRRALELDPALVESNVDKHGFYPDPAQFDAQLAALEQFLVEHPGDRDARLVLALNYLFGGRPRDAVRTIDHAVGAMAEDAAAQKILARAKSVAGS